MNDAEHDRSTCRACRQADRAQHIGGLVLLTVLVLGVLGALLALLAVSSNHDKETIICVIILAGAGITYVARRKH